MLMRSDHPLFLFLVQMQPLRGLPPGIIISLPAIQTVWIVWSNLVLESWVLGDYRNLVVRCLKDWIGNQRFLPLQFKIRMDSSLLIAQSPRVQPPRNPTLLQALTFTTKGVYHPTIPGFPAEIKSNVGTVILGVLYWRHAASFIALKTAQWILTFHLAAFLA